MREFKNFEDRPFVRPERPFLLLAEDATGVVNYHWLENIEDLRAIAEELRNHGHKIINSIEIASCRDVNIY